ncbi:hypothetical protein IKD67_04015 [Candidatus Saccharibacteria bacterium]|nr:hypothetical protein [Candidatus Saccharibacteria bacterium]
MSEINILMTEANGNLVGSKEMIVDAVKEAESFAFPLLKVDWDIDLLVTNRLNEYVIPEDGVGGRARAFDFIEFAIDENHATKNYISETIVHEICHVSRWGKNDEWANTLFKCMISEGIATCFEVEFVKDREEKTLFIKTILERSDEEIERILGILRGQLDAEDFDYNDIFYKGVGELPRWSGYSLGFYLVKKYLEKTGKKIEDVFADKYDEFRVVL